MNRTIPTPKTSTGWLWLAAAGFAAWMLMLNGGNTRAEVAAGFDNGYANTCAPFFAAQPGQPPNGMSPACDANGTHYTTDTAKTPADAALGE